MEEKKKSRAEIVKENSRGLRGTIATELGKDSRHFTSENVQLLKFHGAYQQDDRDVRGRLRAEGKDRKYSFMIRTKNPGGGELSPEQWEILNRVSEQYANTLLTLADGNIVAGRIAQETGDKVVVMTNPFDAAATATVKKSEIKSRELSKISIMPPGLLSTCTDAEILDLIAFLESMGDPKHPDFSK